MRVHSFQRVVEIIPDIAIDLPQSPSHVANFLGALVVENVLPLAVVYEILTGISGSPSKCAEQIFGKTMEIVVEELVRDTSPPVASGVTPSFSHVRVRICTCDWVGL